MLRVTKLGIFDYQTGNSSVTKLGIVWLPNWEYRLPNWEKFGFKTGISSVTKLGIVRLPNWEYFGY